MAEKIAIQIALEGGQEVARQLEGIGEAGQQAFADIAKSAEQVGGFKNIKPEEVTEKLKALGVEGPAAFDKIQQAVKTAARFESLVQGVESVQTALVALGRAAGPIGLAIAAGFQAAVKATIAFAEEVNKVSAAAIKIGASISEYDRLRQGLEKAGISGAVAAEGIAHFQKQLGEISTISFTGLDQAGNAIKLVGETSNSAAQELPKFVEQLRQMPDSAERSRLAIERLGPTTGPALIQALRTGSVAIDQFKQKWGQLTPEMEAAANRIEQAQNRLSNAFNRLNTLSLAPVIVAGLDLATAAVERLGAALERNTWGVFLQAASFALNPIAGLVQQATAAIAQLAASATGEFWNSFAQAAVTSWDQVVSAVQGAGNAILDFASSLAGITWDAILSAGVAAWDALTGAIQSAINKLLEFIGLKPQAPATGGGAPGAARGGLIGGRGSGTSDSNLAWLSRGEHVMPAHVVRQPGVLAFLEALRRGGNLPGFARGGLIPGYAEGGSVARNQIAEPLLRIVDDIQKAMESMYDSMVDLLRSIDGSFANILRANQQSMLQIQKQLASMAGQISGNARGGLLGGRGTGTSDSNLAWVSRGEYITPARAVAQPGVLAFLEALRRSGGNLSAVLDGMGRFALGGLVPRPAFATSGAGPGMSNVTINFPGLSPITGLRASADVVDQLQRAAALAQVRSGGRKPSRYS